MAALAILLACWTGPEMEVRLAWPLLTPVDLLCKEATSGCVYGVFVRMPKYMDPEVFYLEMIE